MMKDKLNVTGRVAITVRGPDGKIKDREVIHNLVVNVGLGHIASLLTASPTGAMSHVAIGEDATPAAGTDTILGAEVTTPAGGRQPFSAPSEIADVSKVVYRAEFAPGQGDGDIVEAGIFNASGVDQGIMLCRTVFGLKTKGPADSLSITWTLSINP